MPVNSMNVLVGTPDQATTGAILSAPIGTTLPTKATDTIDAAFTDCGYISEDGLEFAPDYSTTDIPDWSGATVRRLLEQFTGELTWTMLETNEAAMKVAFGDDYVTSVGATTSHGTQMTIQIGAHQPARKSWAFKMKDGDAKILIVAPNAQITSVDTVTFASNDAIKWPVTLTTYADANGHNLYIYTDDGVFTS